MLNPLINPAFIALGFNPLVDDYYVKVTPAQTDLPTVTLSLGDARTAVGFLKANAVRHFDLAGDLADNYSAYIALQSAAKPLGFEL